MHRTDNPIADFDRWNAEQEAAIELLPKCCDCNEAIYDVFCYQIYDEVLCEECLNRNYRKYTTDLMR